MSHPFDILTVENQTTQYIFTPCPSTKETSVKEALTTLKSAGADVVISLTSFEELNALSVSITEYEQAVKELELSWFVLPIADDDAPASDFKLAWQQAKPQIMAFIKAGKHLAIHCRGGSGRTGLMVALLLIESGIPATQAVDLVQNIRPKALQYPAHLKYVLAYQAS